MNGLLVCGSLYLINGFAGCELDASTHDDDHTAGCTEFGVAAPRRAPPRGGRRRLRSRRA